jgi:hypothetical protein
LLGIIEMFLFGFIFFFTFTYKDFSVLPLSLAGDNATSTGLTGMGVRSMSASPDYLAQQSALAKAANSTYGSASSHAIKIGNGHAASNGIPAPMGSAWKRPSAPVMSPCSAFCQIFALSDFFTRPLEESEDTPLLED